MTAETDPRIIATAGEYAEAIPDELCDVGSVRNLVQAAFIQGAKLGQYFEKERWVKTLDLIDRHGTPILKLNGETENRH